MTTDIWYNNDSAKGVVVQSDGKVVVAGYGVNSSANRDFTVIRYNTNGSLDTTFGGTGTVLTNVNSVSPYGDEATSVTLQSDGKIVVAGYTGSPPTTTLAVVRYNADGTLDTTWGGTGKVTTTFGAARSGAYSVAVQSDGKVVVAGFRYNGTDNDVLVARYNSNGTLDTGGFSSPNGYVTINLAGTDYAYGVALQSDGKIVAAGSGRLVRYSSNGTLDTATFGGGTGMVAVSGMRAVLIQPDGMIVTAGGLTDMTVRRFTSAGAADATFNGTGSVTITGVNVAYGVARQSDGKLVAAGAVGTYPNQDFAVARLNADGTLDTTFDGDGKLTTAIGTGQDAANGVAIQPSDGKIVAVGSASSGNDDWAVVRYWP